MPLTPEEHQQARDLARGMLLAQKDTVSLAGNLVNSPHFTNVPYPVKMEAMRTYSQLEQEDPSSRAVNATPEKREVAKAVAKAALTEGAVSLPISATMAILGSPVITAAHGMKHHPIESAMNAPKRSLTRTLRRSLPLAGGLFAANAVVGAIREAVRQKALMRESQSTNKYLDRIKDTSSDEDINAMLLATTPLREQARLQAVKEKKFVDEVVPSLDPRILNVERITNPSSSYPAMWAAQQAADMESDIKEYGVKEGWRTKKSELNTKPFKTRKKKWNSNPVLRHTKTSNIQKAKSVKIRREAMQDYNAALDEGLTSEVKQARIAKAAVKKFLRI